MNIVVLIKQVPVVSQLKFDAEKKTVVREGVPNTISSFDTLALAEALRLRQDHGGEVTALTMGPPQAREALVQCLAMGADRAVHLVDRAFAGADTLATARALALAIQRQPFDLIFAGRYSVDAETGQVGPEVAELLDLPQVTGVRRLEVLEDGLTLLATREIDDGEEVVECTLPALLTAADRLNRGPSISPEGLEAAGQKPIETVTAADLSPDASLFGLAGSPTFVTGIQSIEIPRRREMIDAGTPQAKVDRLVELLFAEGLFGTWRQRHEERPHPSTAPKPPSAAPVWVVTEAAGNQLRPVTLELLGAGIALAERLGGELVAVVFGDRVPPAQATELAAHGAHRILCLQHARLREYDPEAYAGALAQAIQRYRPHSVLVPATANGRDFLPRVAARLKLGLTGDCVGLEIDDREQLVQLKPAFGGNIVAPILSRTFPQMATVRPGILTRAAPDWERRAPCEAFEPTLERPARWRLRHSAPAPLEVSPVEAAEIVVGVGTGLGGPENLPVIYELAETLGASVAASRPVTDRGWLPRRQQVGLSGKSIAPQLYFAIGISGAFNHTVGIQRAGIVVAINTNPRAPIFRAADFGIVGDWAVIVPLLSTRLRAGRAAGVLR
ncbi:MAG: electron transfer flavoprotein alpha/ beta subunit [Chloroflexi bacterium]|nr:electron transfer flavoprotein alpha/ beta subunit [Chloroflexota bacterium]